MGEHALSSPLKGPWPCSRAEHPTAVVLGIKLQHTNWVGHTFRPGRRGVSLLCAWLNSGFTGQFPPIDSGTLWRSVGMEGAAQSPGCCHILLTVSTVDSHPAQSSGTRWLKEYSVLLTWCQGGRPWGPRGLCSSAWGTLVG